MTKFKIIFTGVIVVAAVVTPLLIQRLDQAKLRENKILLREHVDQLVDLEGENQRLSNLIAQTKTYNATAPDDRTDELAQLRAKVEALRAHTNQLAELPKKLAERRLLAGVQAFYSGDFNLLEHNHESAIT